MADRGSPVAPSSASGSGFRGQWNVRRVVLVTLSVLAIVALFALLLRFYAVIFILFVAVVFSIATRPAADWLHRKKLPLPVAVIIVYVGLSLLLLSGLLLVTPLFVEQVTTIIGNLPDYYQTIRDGLVRSPIILVRALAYRTPDQFSLQPVAPTTEAAIPEAAPALDIFRITEALGEAGFVAVTLLALAFYWTLYGERTVRALILRVPMQSREKARDIVATMERKVGAFLRGQAILCISVAVLMLIALTIIQLPYALSLALLAGVLEAIPILGPTLGAIPALLVAVAVAPDKVIWVVVAVIIIQQFESNVLIPRVMDKSVGVNPVVTILSIIGFGALLGLPGAILAIPMAAIFQVIISYIVFEPPAPMPQDEGRGRASVLRYEAQQLRQDVRKQLREKEEVADSDSDRVEDLIESIVTDVDSLLSQRDNANAVEDNV
jgi:predicted PurR-regulated permease PerM